MENVIPKNITAYKNIGETPLECLERVRLEHKIDPKTPMTYAGRLDPMAEGILIILVGEECKNKEKYLDLDKEYEIEVLFGVGTDSQDVLGLIDKVNVGNEKKLEKEKADTTEKIDLQKYAGKFTQEYPKYSSKRIAKDFEEVEPKNVEIYFLEKLGEREVLGNEVMENSIKRIQKVTGDFRQVEIIERWQEFGQTYGNTKFKIIKLKIKCSSGTYMRTLAERIGKDAGVGAVAYSIKRNSVAEYKIS